MVHPTDTLVPRRGTSISFWRRALVTAAVLVAASITAPVRAAAADTPPLPHSMAAIGDSITRAYDACCSYGDHPGQSWSTGWTWYDGITSHYERILARTSTIQGHNYNDAVTGAKMASGPAQAATAASQGAQYVTILLGANDLCTSSTLTMTAVADFRSQFTQTLQAIPATTHVFVSSIPNIYQLWQVLHTNSIARYVWQTARICQSMLASTNTETQRQQVLTRESAFNQVLADVCAQFTNCRWDGGATYGYAFSPSRVSTLDYFHPSLSGQAALANLTWSKSWWASV
jgi:lysophospholipase L1-like esterase